MNVRVVRGENAVHQRKSERVFLNEAFTKAHLTLEVDCAHVTGHRGKEEKCSFPLSFGKEY